MMHSARQGNTLDAAEINGALQGTPLAGHVHHLAEVESTNDLALAAALQGATVGAWVADAQTAGRGRGGHAWHSAPGDGLYVSVLCTPRLDAAPGLPARLSLVAGLAAWEAIREVTGIVADIRWPNDLLTRPEASGRSRKLGGVLVEAAFAAGPTVPALRYAVIGIGINAAHRGFPAELGDVASSLFLEGWQHPDRQPLLLALLLRLQNRLRDAELQPDHGGSLWFAQQMERASTWIRGKRVRVPEEGGYTGVTAGLDKHGFLLVHGEEGRLHTVRSGGVREA